MSELFQGIQVRTFEELSSYIGKSAIDVIVGLDRKNIFKINHAQMKANYDGGVDFQLRDETALLCSQTADFLYNQFSSLHTNYLRGTHVELEKLVESLTVGLKTDRDKMLAIMRFCRDLYKKAPGRDIKDDDYIFGGTEEQLIEKGEELCECLGRLFVGLCEIADIPARWVIHIVGGHIVAEAYVEGGWAYVDPRCGIYFLKSDGKFASTWDMYNAPELIYQQSETVKLDVSDRWTWDERAWRCKNMFFTSQEITGITNYHLDKSTQYDYSRVTQKLATELGLWEYNNEYEVLTKKIFGLTDDGWRLKWSKNMLRKIPLIYRNDGYSQFFYHQPPMSPEQMNEQFVDPLAGTNVDILEWGLGPGSVFCYDTKVGQIYLQDLTDIQRAAQCEGGRRVWQNVMGMIRNGVDPLKAAIDRGHERGLKVYTRLEMNHEYGPASEDNWMWVGFVGDFNKQNPQFRIPGNVNLDFKYSEVRNFKLDILREAAERGCDCISMDFAVYPPYFENPDTEIMTEFIRDVRKMAEEVGQTQGRRIEIMIRFPSKTAQEIGIDWKQIVREKLVDTIVPSFDCYGTDFDINIDEFISMRNRTGVKVYGCIFQAMGFFDSDETPESEKIGPTYDKAKTKDIYYAQAMLFHRAGADGIQLAMAGGEWSHNPFFDDLADPRKMLYADKRYMANQEAADKPVTVLNNGGVKTISMRIADDPCHAIAEGHKPKAAILFYLNRHLERGEKIEIFVNGQNQITVLPKDISWTKPILEKFDYYDPDWWRSGEYTVELDAASLVLGKNEFNVRFYSSDERKLEVRWIDLKVTY